VACIGRATNQRNNQMARKNARAAVVTDAPELTADAVVEVVANDAAVAPEGWAVITGGFEPDVIWSASALRADDDGMGAMMPVGVITSDAQLDAELADMAASVADVPPMILVGDAEVVEAPVVMVADVALRLPVMLMTVEGARQLAEIFSAKVGMPIELVRDGLVIDTVLPGRARAAATPRAVRTEGNGGNLARAMAHLGAGQQDDPARCGHDGVDVGSGGTCRLHHHRVSWGIRIDRCGGRRGEAACAIQRSNRVREKQWRNSRSSWSKPCQVHAGYG
jgi:hypothetical protein